MRLSAYKVLIPTYAKRRAQRARLCMIYTAPSPSARTAGDFPDGLRSEELPVRPFDCVKTMHILPRNEKVAAALRQTCNSIVLRPYKVKRNNSPAAEIPTIFLQSLDYFLCG